jgi:hypothetical protein
MLVLIAFAHLSCSRLAAGSWAAGSWALWAVGGRLGLRRPWGGPGCSLLVAGEAPTRAHVVAGRVPGFRLCLASSSLKLSASRISVLCSLLSSSASGLWAPGHAPGSGSGGLCALKSGVLIMGAGCWLLGQCTAASCRLAVRWCMSSAASSPCALPVDAAAGVELRRGGSCFRRALSGSRAAPRMHKTDGGGAELRSPSTSLSASEL